MMDDPQRYLDPLVLAKVRSLELQARLIVEGYLSGMHKSPYHGFSVEFAQHREYVPGDDIKHVDWKVYGRTGRFYLRGSGISLIGKFFAGMRLLLLKE